MKVFSRVWDSATGRFTTGEFLADTDDPRWIEKQELREVRRNAMSRVHKVRKRLRSGTFGRGEGRHRERRRKLGRCDPGRLLNRLITG